MQAAGTGLSAQVPASH